MVGAVTARAIYCPSEEEAVFNLVTRHVSLKHHYPEVQSDTLSSRYLYLDPDVDFTLRPAAQSRTMGPLEPQ